LKALAVLREQHLQAVADLVVAIDAGDVEVYLETRFTCPAS
jgi:hypothetical protein